MEDNLTDDRQGDAVTDADDRLYRDYLETTETDRWGGRGRSRTPEDPNAFITEAESLLNAATMGIAQMDVKTSLGGGGGKLHWMAKGLSLQS